MLAGFAEVLREERIEDGVYAGIAIGQAVGDDAEGEGGVVQGEPSKHHPHGYDVVGHPADEEGGHHQEHGLDSLKKRDKTGTHHNSFIVPCVFFAATLKSLSSPLALTLKSLSLKMTFSWL